MSLPDGRIVSGSRDNTLRVWNASDGNSIFPGCGTISQYLLGKSAESSFAFPYVFDADTIITCFVFVESLRMFVAGTSTGGLLFCKLIR